ARLEAGLPGLPASGLHERDRVQSDRRDAAHAPRQARDGAAVDARARAVRPRRRARRQRVHLTRASHGREEVEEGAGCSCTQNYISEESVMTTITARDISLREGYARVGDVELHYVEAGDGPLVVLLHGFPEFWYGWRQQIKPLVDAGFRVVAPDLRGYNLSSKPDRFIDYTADKMAADIRGLIGELGEESALVVGHDWGGSVAWTLAMNHPEVVDRLAILNAAHPRRLNEGLKHPRQLLRSWYFFYFQLPKLPERRARRRHWRFFKRFMRDARPSYTAGELDRYVEAWSRPGAAK